jgi:CheY-like chemotaxis protein
MAADPALSAAPMRVLCVDDDRINAMLLGELCRLAGDVEARFAETAGEAIEIAARWTPQLLVVDLHLPDGDGLSLLPRLRQAAGRSQLPAVLCTAELLSDIQGRAASAGYDACWAKPVALADVRAALSGFAATRHAAAPE